MSSRFLIDQTERKMTGACCVKGCFTRVETRKNHGTPQEFKEAVLKALGEISVVEAEDAIREYETRYWTAPEDYQRGPKPTSFLIDSIPLLTTGNERIDLTKKKDRK